MPNRVTPRFASTRIQYQPRPSLGDLPDIDDDGITDGQILKWSAAVSEYVASDDNDTTDHTALSNIGTNTHAQIDTHIADGTEHFTEASIDHTAIMNVGSNAHSAIDTHIADGTLHFTEASIDHGSIAGTGDDDHTQYYLADGTRALNGPLDHDGTTVGFYSTTPVAQSSAYTRDATIVEDRTLLQSSAATATNNNNVLAALIADLQALGLIG